MNPDFESTLRAHWQSKNFGAWNAARMIYADWLQENGYPLFHMASVPCEMHEVRASRGSRHPWMWRLYFNVTELPDKPHGWKGCVNRFTLFGIDPTCFKFMDFDYPGVDWRTYDGEFRLRFTVLFRPRRSIERMNMIPKNPTLSQLRSMNIYCKLDTRTHPAGPQAIFWPKLQPAETLFSEGLFEAKA